MTTLPGSSRTVVFILRAKLFAKTILEHSSRTVFTKSVRILRTGCKEGFGTAVVTCRESEETKLLHWEKETQS